MPHSQKKNIQRQQNPRKDLGVGQIGALWPTKTGGRRPTWCHQRHGVAGRRGGRPGMHTHLGG